MKVISGITVDNNVVFFSYAASKSGRLIPYRDFFKELPSPHTDLDDFITNSIKDIDDTIRKHERKYSFKAEDIYFGLSSTCAKKTVVEDVLSLTVTGAKKKITHRDIVFAKKHIENVTLEWEDVCIHHVVLQYQIEGSTYSAPPIGMWARKIKVKSLLISVRSTLLDTFVNLFDNCNRKFSGFVYEPFCNLGAVVEGDCRSSLIALHMGNEKTSVVSFPDSNVFLERSFDFGEKNIIVAIADKFLLPPALASQLLFDYSSFRQTPLSKEVCIRDRGNYVRISSMSLNSFVTQILREELATIIGTIQSDVAAQPACTQRYFSFLGRLARIDGFYGFLKNYFSLDLKKPSKTGALLPAFGCIRYGMFKFFEQYPPRMSLMRKICRVYGDYF